MFCKRKSFFIFLLILFVWIFKTWFLSGFISSGDFLPLTLPFVIYPFVWGWNTAIGGMGGVVSPFSWLHFILVIPPFLLEKIGFAQIWIQKIGYLYPLLIILFCFPVILYKQIFPTGKKAFLSTFIYSLNTYILMIIGGGQIFIAFSYAIVPIIFSLCFVIKKASMRSNNKLTLFKLSLFLGILLSFQAMLDLRIAYVTFVLLFLFILFEIFLKFREEKKSLSMFFPLIYGLIVPMAITGAFHAYWIIPSLLIHVSPLNQLGDIYSSSGAVKFFSFARFENTLSLLHPNWPENIFGKVYFMRAEFLLLPIIAFSSLLFIKKENKDTREYILFFSLLAILGAFLAKGANEPFGGLYLFLFEHVPGFLMFRDPTKWYVLIAISYSILIPFSIDAIYNLISNFKKTKIIDFKFKINNKSKIINLQNIFLILTVSYFMFLIRPALSESLSGMFEASYIPNEYSSLRKFLSNQPDFFRTLWLPQVQRYGYYSDNHRTLTADQFFGFNKADKIYKELNEKVVQEKVRESAIKYIIVPYDSGGEIFVKDRKYNEKEYRETIDMLREINWIQEIKGFGGIAVFEVLNPQKHFFVNNPKIFKKSTHVLYSLVNLTKYKIELNNVRSGELLVFSETYDKNWKFKITNSNYEIKSRNYKSLNSFVIPKEGNFKGEVYYEAQKWGDLGILISAISTLAVVGSISILKIKQT